MEALSVYHARPLDGYRKTQSLRAGSASTEDLRKAMISYRALFQDLVGAAAGRGLRRPAAAASQRRTAETSDHTRKIAILPQKTATAARASNRTAGTPQ